MKEFLKTMLSSSGEVSSKRVLGMLCILYYFIIFAITYFIPPTPEQISMSNQILFVGAGLLGVGIFEKK